MKKYANLLFLLIVEEEENSSEEEVEDEDEVEDNDIFSAEKIMKKRETDDGQVQYFIKWLGYSHR